MLVLLDKNKVRLAGLTDLQDYQIKKNINKGEELSFSLLISDTNAALVQEEGYIETKEQRYVIKSVKRQKTIVSIECRQDVEELKSKLHLNGFDNGSDTYAGTVRRAISGTGWTVEEVNAPAKRRTLKLGVTDAYTAIEKAANKFNCEFRFDSQKQVIYLAEEFGEDRGVYFSDELNLKSLHTSSDTLDFATRLYVRGKDGMTFADINGGRDYVQNFSYSTKVISKVWEDNRYEDKLSLLEDAERKLKDMCSPRASYEVDVIDLASLNEEYTFLNYSLGDYVYLLVRDKGFKDRQRIVEIVTYPLEPERNTCVLANCLLTFEEIQRRNEETAGYVDGAFNEDGTINTDKVVIDANSIPDVVSQPNYIYNSSFGRFNDKLKPAYWDTEGIVSSAYQTTGNYSLHLTEGQKCWQQGLTGVELIDGSKWRANNTRYTFRALGIGNVKVSVWYGNKRKLITSEDTSEGQEYIDFNLNHLMWLPMVYYVDVAPGTDVMSIHFDCTEGYAYIDSITGGPITTSYKSLTYQDGPMNYNDPIETVTEDLPDAKVGQMWFKRSIG